MSEAWKLVPSLNRFRAIFATFLNYHVFQHVVLPINVKFHVDITVCDEVIARANLGAWELVLSLKLRIRSLFVIF
jgi:hypothetical protein